MEEVNRAEDDTRLQSLVRRCYPTTKIPEITIQRDAGDLTIITIRTHDPGSIIGWGNEKIQVVWRALQDKTGYRVQLQVYNLISGQWEVVLGGARPYLFNRSAIHRNRQ